MPNTNQKLEAAKIFTLKNIIGTEVEVSNYGGILKSFKVKHPNGEVYDLVLGFDTIGGYMSEDYFKEYPYFGAAVGRVGNRIFNAEFMLNNKLIKVTKNNGENQLHGGAEGFDKKIWDVVKQTENSVTFTYLAKDGEEGFPGNLHVELSFTLSENSNELSYEYKGTTDATTVFNPTHHSYFTLNNGHGSINEYSYKINASNYLGQDENLCCLGEIIPVENTRYDFRKFVELEDRWSNGYDQSFVIDDYQKNKMTVAAEAKSLESGIKLAVATTAPIVHLYTGTSIPMLIGKNATEYQGFSGFCLETQIHPNAMNVPAFPSTVLNPGETFHTKTVYTITFEKE